MRCFIKKIALPLLTVLLLAIACKKNDKIIAVSSEYDPLLERPYAHIDGTIWADANEGNRIISFFDIRFLQYYILSPVTKKIDYQFICKWDGTEDGIKFILNSPEIAPADELPQDPLYYYATIEDDKMTISECDASWNIIKTVGEYVQTESYNLDALQYSYVPEAVDLGEMTDSAGGTHHIKWASCNLGGAKESDIGPFFGWGELHSQISYYPKTFYTNDRPAVLPPERDAAHVRLGGGWRMPNGNEIEALVKATNNGICSITEDTVNDIPGVRITRLTGSNKDNYIFLPYYDDNRSVVQIGGTGGTKCYLWTSTSSQPNDIPYNAVVLHYYKNSLTMTSENIALARPIRPVCDI